jgi:hypothetical protein
MRALLLPRVLALLLVTAGIGWFIFLAPWPSHDLATSMEVLGFVAEAASMLWLLVKGVNKQQ